MPITYKKIADATVGSGGAASIDFTSIPATYTDLVIKLSARNAHASAFSFVKLEVNSNTSAIYSDRLLFGTGSTAGSASSTPLLDIYVSGANATASTFGSAEIYFPNYAGSTNKSVSIDSVSENNATDARQGLTAGLISTTSAISSIQLKAVIDSSTSTTFVQYTTATLYGIKKD
jgi:hypothetical protein